MRVPLQVIRIEEKERKIWPWSESDCEKRRSKYNQNRSSQKNRDWTRGFSFYDILSQDTIQAK